MVIDYASRNDCNLAVATYCVNLKAKGSVVFHKVCYQNV